MWKEAQAGFAQGDYKQAATSLEAIIKLSSTTTNWFGSAPVAPAESKQQWLDPVFFMLGAARFNAKDWPDAILILSKYQQLFPQSPRINQARFSLGQAQLAGGHPEDAIPVFTSLLGFPEYHQKAFLLLIESCKRAKQSDQAIGLMEKEKAQPNLDPSFTEKMNSRILPLYIAAGSAPKALAILQEMDADIEHVPDMTAFNAMAVQLGDFILAKNDLAGAVSCYRKVRDNNQIIALQKLQIEDLRRQHAANMASIQTDPLHSDELQAENKDLDNQIATEQQTLAAYQTLPPVLPPLYLRVARAYSVAGQLWESAVVYNEILRRYPNCAEAEAALYGSIVLFDRLKQTDRALALSQSYLTHYPKGKYADSVTYLRGILAYDAQQFDQAIGYFQDALRDRPDHPRREQIELILGDIKLRQQKFDDAIASYQLYEKDYPQGAGLEKAEYRSALARLFGGKGDDAEKAFQAYLQKYPDGAYVADGEYRLDVIKFARQDYDGVLADGAAWQKKHGKAGPLAEVLALMGDCYAAQNKNGEAVAAYVSSYQAALTPEVLNYSLFAAAKLLSKESKWTDIVAMFQEFIKNNPEHPTVVSAISWIGRADIKLGKVDEAKRYMSDAAKQYLDDPSREAVDEIITQLAQLYARKHLAPAPASASTPAQAPLEATPDTANEMEQALDITDAATKPTARSRLLFAKAELARLQRKPELEAQTLLEIAKNFHPEDLSPIALGQVGDCLVQNGQPDLALPFYNQLMDQYDSSEVVDYAYNGLAQIAYNQKDYSKAEHYYFKALDKGQASAKLKEITLGEAQSLLALNRPEEARPYFEQVASTRAWRGEATALSVYSLGDIQMAEGKFAEANAYYQRVFVAYQKYPAIQAKAYFKSGEAFEKLGKTLEAVNTYTEMLKNPNLAAYPETADAQKHLDHLAQK